MKGLIKFFKGVFGQKTIQTYQCPHCVGPESRGYWLGEKSYKKHIREAHPNKQTQ